MKLEIPIFILSFIILSSSITFAQDSRNQDSINLVRQGDSILYKVAALSRNKLDSAVFYIDEAIQHFFKAKSWEQYAASLSAMTTYHFYRDDLTQLEYYSQKSIIETERLLGKEHLIYATALNNIATLHRKRGDYDKAIKLLNQSLEIKNNHSNFLLVQSSIYQNLSMNYRLKGEFLKALNFRKYALEVSLDTLKKENPIIGIYYKNIGLAYNDLNSPDSALFYLEKGLSVLQNGPQLSNSQTERNIIMTLHGIAEVWLFKSNIVKAKQIINQVLEIQKGDKAYRKAFTYELLAKILIEENNLIDALSAIKTANKLAQINYKKSNYGIIARKFLLTAEIFQRQNSLDSALHYSQIALQKLSPGFNYDKKWSNPPPDKLLAKSDALDILILKASTLRQLYDFNKNTNYLLQALDTYESAVELIKYRRSGIMSDNSKNKLAAKSGEIYEQAINAALEMYSMTQDPKYQEKAFLLAENNKALSLLETINEQMAQGNSKIPDSLLMREKSLRIDITYYQKKILTEKQKKGKANAKKLKNWEDNLFEYQQKHDLLVSSFENYFPLYHQLKYDSRPTSVEKIRSALLSPNKALIEYFIGENKIYMFCLTSDDLEVKSINRNDLQLKQIQQIRDFVSTPPIEGITAVEIENYHEASFGVYKLVLKPLLDQLTAKIDELIIIPDGILAYIPFDLLHYLPKSKSKSGNSLTSNLLLHRFSIGYDYSITLLEKNTTRKKIDYPSDFIAYAPLFHGDIAMLRNCDGTQLSQLKCNQNEVNNIGSILEGKINSGQEASAANFLNSNNQNRIIHLATHACVDNENPMLNKVYFSDNSLTLLDFYNTQLNTELVVLSACNTGIGKIQEGEGVMSIARGFMAAGSPSTMLSLWSVDDCSTSEMMSYYYKNLKAGVPKNKALQNAKIEFLKTAPQVMKHPFYWGAFVQFGNVEPLEFSSEYSLKFWIILGIGLLLLGLILYLRSRNQGHQN